MLKTIYIMIYLTRPELVHQLTDKIIVYLHVHDMEFTQIIKASEFTDA